MPIPPSPKHRLIVNQSGHVLTVTFNNPPRHFFDEAMSIELDELTRALRRDSSVRAVLFTGTDSTYLTHFDVPSSLQALAVFRCRSAIGPLGSSRPRRVTVASHRLDTLLRRTAARDAMFLARTYAALDRLSRLDQVVITAINGLALGMGAIFALACDIRVMADDTHIGLPESGLAMLAGVSGTQRLTRTVGTGAAMEILLEGRWLTAAEAEQLRMVQHVRTRDELHSATMEIAERLGARSAVVTRELKRAVYDTATRPRGPGLRREAAGTIRTLTTRDARSALANYGDHLAAHETLTDEVIRDGWEPLLGHHPTLRRQAASPHARRRS